MGEQIPVKLRVNAQFLDDVERLKKILDSPNKATAIVDAVGFVLNILDFHKNNGYKEFLIKVDTTNTGEIKVKTYYLYS